MSRRIPSEVFEEAVKTRDSARAILEGSGIEADCILAITDGGPSVEIRVSEKDYISAQEALPFTIGGAIVKIVKKQPKKK